MSSTRNHPQQEGNKQGSSLDSFLSFFFFFTREENLSQKPQKVSRSSSVIGQNWVTCLSLNQSQTKEWACPNKLKPVITQPLVVKKGGATPTGFCPTPVYLNKGRSKKWSREVLAKEQRIIVCSEKEDRGGWWKGKSLSGFQFPFPVYLRASATSLP